MVNKAARHIEGLGEAMEDIGMKAGSGHAREPEK